MSLSDVLGWKFNSAPGIRTREKLDGEGNPTGEMEIFDWPAALGAEPTPAQVAQWTAEFSAIPPTPDPAAEIVAGIEAARAAGAAAADLDGLKAAFADLCDALAGQQPGQASQIAGKPK